MAILRPDKGRLDKPSNLAHGSPTFAHVASFPPLGPDNEHPGYADLLMGQQHVADIVQAVQNSPDWANTAIIVTYDENGGRWDHVAPPTVDRWGVGSRVPAIIISPFAKMGFVDHTQYETDSILKTLELVYGLQPLATHDANANSLINAFDLPPGKHDHGDGVGGSGVSFKGDPPTGHGSSAATLQAQLGNALPSDGLDDWALGDPNFSSALTDGSSSPVVGAALAGSGVNLPNFDLGAGVVEQPTNDGGTGLLQPLSSWTEMVDQAFALMAQQT